jgi:Ca2+/Na+ antiporter
MNLKQYLSSQYLFQINSAFIAPGEKLFLVAGAVFTLLAVVLKIAAVTASNPTDAKYRNKFFGVFLFLGLSELVWYACRYQNVRFFGSRFVAWLLVLISVVWFVRILVSVFKNYRQEKSEWEKEQQKLKYLPK